MARINEITWKEYMAEFRRNPFKMTEEVKPEGKLTPAMRDWPDMLRTKVKLSSV